jgi:hypothetical protein
MMRDEYRRAERIYPPFHSAHEAAAVIREQFEAFWETVKNKKICTEAIEKELIQLAAMCARAVHDLEL